MTKLRSGVPAAGTINAQDFRGLAFRFLVTIDAEGFSRRSAAEQARVQEGLERAMKQAAASAGLHRERWYRQPRGDGEFAVLPEGTDGLSLVADYPRRLASAVAAVNDERKSEPRLRVRMAIHHGAVAPGLLGPVGAAPVVIARLVDAEPARRLLSQRSNLDIALIVSDTVYKEVIQSRLHNLNPETFRRVIVRAKGITYAGYLYQDGDARLLRASPGAGREPAGERQGQVTELIRFLDDEWQVERGQHRRQPAEVLHPQFGAQPAWCLRRRP
jgi:hypothetical protein